MKILITGNMGYVGPAVVKQLRETFPSAIITGFDAGYFAHCLTDPVFFPESLTDVQYFGDVRNFPEILLRDTDVVIALAAISNDPMGSRFEEITYKVNHLANIELARKARLMGVKSFIFASSCSMYGAALDGGARSEDSPLNPLTAYAKSKVRTEEDLRPLAADTFNVTCLRFSTACGMSNRLRLDLVLNDFVAGAITDKKITILSDGTPWRPLINTKDMARAIEWAIIRDTTNSHFLAVNVGTEAWNYQVKELAEAVAQEIPGVEVSINPNSQPDKRSYRVNFDLYKKLAPDHQPIFDLKTTVREIADGLTNMKFDDRDFRNSKYIRLRILNDLQEKNILNGNLEWTSKVVKQAQPDHLEMEMK